MARLARVIMTGMPEGIGPIVASDIVECFIERIGNIRVPTHGVLATN